MIIWINVIYFFGFQIICGLCASHYENCSIEPSQLTFDVLPGTGWDNLANLELGRILDLNFSKCLYSNDNRYLLPNRLSLRPVKKSDVEMFSEMFSHYMNYTSITSKNINVNVGGGFHGFEAGGSFSYENTRVKQDQLQTKSVFTRVQIRYTIFKSYFEPDTPLYPVFKNRIMDIAGLIVENKDTLYPSYLADMIIRDYGTHVVRSVDAGAALSKIDTLDSKYVMKHESDETKISAAASASFLSFFNLNTKFQSKVSHDEVDEYNKQCAKTHIDAIGGGLLGSNFSLEKWQDSVMTNLVPIDRMGDPIYYVITPRALPDLDYMTVNKVYNLLKEACKRYYARNARKGCLDFRSANFNPDANIDAGNCKKASVNFTLGGTYQTCWGRQDQCGGVFQVNPLTGTYSCPTGFSSIKLQSALNQCQTYCRSYWIFWKKCSTECSYYATYWCSPNQIGSNRNGYQFGGIFGLGKPECPLGYIALLFGLNHKICVTTDSDAFNPFAIKLGGIYSCNVGNPLAKYTFSKKSAFNKKSSKMHDLEYWPKSCAQGYVSNFASIERGCQISYCTETNVVSLGPSPPLERPPFIDLNYNPNSTRVTIFKTSDGKMAIKDKFGSWNIEEVQSGNRRAFIGWIIGSILIVMFIGLVLLFIQRRHYQRKLKLRNIQTFSEEDPIIMEYSTIKS